MRSQLIVGPLAKARALAERIASESGAVLSELPSVTNIENLNQWLTILTNRTVLFVPRCEELRPVIVVSLLLAMERQKVVVCTAGTIPTEDSALKECSLIFATEKLELLSSPLFDRLSVLHVEGA